jgi:2-polyprenyl-3-methyl-5-hydroxy-6-metoxy-1,4-benzoquinol methylase
MSNGLDYLNQISKYIEELIREKGSIHILEAGCGTQSWFDYGKEKTFIEGIDISPDQLAKNETLHKKILGDIQTFKLRPCYYDFIVCWNVLEHLQKPEKALDNLSQSLSKGGIMVVGVPNTKSFKGLVTKYTPYIFHRWVYKYIYNYNILPTPSFFRKNMSPDSLMKYTDNSSLAVEWIHFYHVSFSDFWGQGYKKWILLFYAVYYVLGLIVKTFTFGQISITKTELVVVYRKKNK